MTEQMGNVSAASGFHNEQRRTFERFTSRFPVKFKDARCDYGTDVILHNLSADGAKITVRERLYLNDSVSIEVEMLDGRGPLTLRGEVIWAQEKEPNLWDVGLKFHKVVLMDLWRIYETVNNGSTS